MYKCIIDIDREEEKRLVNTLSKCIEQTTIKEIILENVYGGYGYTRKPILHFDKHM
jgi:hypothetical protein